jgi:Fe-coproporphyrin III synthase
MRCGRTSSGVTIGKPMALNINAFLNTVTSRVRALPVVILYVTEECNFRCITCSYRKALPGELSLAEIQQLAASLQCFGLKHIAFSGGEPLMRHDFPSICKAFHHNGVKETLLTNGLLLEKRFSEISPYLTEIIVSLDGADRATHDDIRGVTAFDRIVAGIRKVARESPRIQVSLRTVVQKKNFRQLPAIVALGHSLGAGHVSFLAPDMATDAFGRTSGKEAGDRLSSVMLGPAEVRELRSVLEEMSVMHAEEYRTGFIAQSPEAMAHILAYFAASQGLAPFPPVSCNAPMVSAVITSTGAMKPCFFLPEMGSVRSSDLGMIANSPSAIATRKAVKACTPDTCRRCVCTLHVSPLSAFLDRF